MDEFYIYQNAIWRANAEQQSEVKSLKITANNPFEIHILIAAALLKFQLEFCVFLIVFPPRLYFHTNVERVVEPDFRFNMKP